jgi:AAA domain, putative AbiEii toxin, Type IV TA system
MYAGRPTPFSALSDGYKAFVSWVGDLVGHLCHVAPKKIQLNDISGIVLIDEIDLHLHPAWQRTVVSALAAAFPRLQFVMTSHSPLVASTLRKENIFVTDTADDGSATVKQIEENVHGRSADQLLLSSYFGLRSTLPPGLEAAGKTLFAQAAEGDSQAALAVLEQLAAPTRASQEVVPAFAQALQRAKTSADKRTPRRVGAKPRSKRAK